MKSLGKKLGLDCVDGGKIALPLQRLNYREWVDQVADDMKWETEDVGPKTGSIRRRALAMLLCLKTVKGQVCSKCGHPRAGSVNVCNSREKPCQCRTCPRCSKRRSAKVREKLAPKIAQLEHDRPAGFRWRHIVFTSRYKPGDLADLTVEALELRSVEMRKIWRKIWAEYLKTDGAAALVSSECGEHGAIHLHVLYWGPWADKADLTARAMELSPVAGFCDVREIKDGIAGVAEVVKYTLKGLNYGDERWFAGRRMLCMHPLLVARWEIATAGRRLFEMYGAFRGMKLEEKDEGEELEEREPEMADECPRCHGRDWSVVYEPIDQLIKECHKSGVIAFPTRWLSARESEVQNGKREDNDGARSDRQLTISGFEHGETGLSRWRPDY